MVVLLLWKTYVSMPKKVKVEMLKTHNECNKKQNGRSMLEMLGVLAIIGVLSALAVWGLRYAYNKHKANQILEDVGLGLQSLADRKDEEGEFELNFAKASGHEVRGVMLMRSDGRADFVKVAAVNEKVCDNLNKMQGDKLTIYQSYGEGAGLIKMIGCAEENTMYMTFMDYGQRVGGCYPDCGLHSHCINFYECDCDEGYQQNTSGECEAVGCGAIRPTEPQGADTPACCDKWGWTWNDQDGCVCPQNTFWDPNSAECQPNCETNPTSLNNMRQVCCEQLGYVWVSQDYECTCPEDTAWSDDDKRCVSNCGDTQPADPITITSQECCEHWKDTNGASIWVWDAQNSTCDCPDGSVWDETLQSCEVLGPFCSYTFMPGSAGTYVADCSYTLLDGSAGTYVSDCYYEYSETDTSVSISSARARGGCPADQYCALRWSDETCSTLLYDTASGRIYGVCSPKDDFNVMCLKNASAASISSAQARGGCPADQYCALRWSDETCSTLLYDTATSTMYGVCSPKDDFNIMCSKNASAASISSTRARGGCPANQYCYLKYSNESCTQLNDGESTEITAYGVCESYDLATDPNCPAVTPK